MSEYDIIFIILGVVVPIVSGLTAWKKIKSRIHDIRELLDVVDDSIADDAVNELEFRKTWRRIYKVITGKDPPNPGV